MSGPTIKEMLSIDSFLSKDVAGCLVDAIKQPGMVVCQIVVFPVDNVLFGGLCEQIVKLITEVVILLLEKQPLGIEADFT